MGRHFSNLMREKRKEVLVMVLSFGLFNPRFVQTKSMPECCPVAAYELYASKRPVPISSNDAPFYLGVNHHKKTDSPWYKSQPMGKDKLWSMMTRMAKNAGVVGQKKNHSIHCTMCGRLVHAGVQGYTIIPQLSCHTNVQSINNYASSSRNQQQIMCSIFSG